MIQYKFVAFTKGKKRIGKERIPSNQDWHQVISTLFVPQTWTSSSSGSSAFLDFYYDKWKYLF